VLQEMQGDASLRGMIAKGVKVEEFYRCFRSFRRGAENTAMNNGVFEESLSIIIIVFFYSNLKIQQPLF
jgi:hypothetical protein